MKLSVNRTFVCFCLLSISAFAFKEDPFKAIGVDELNINSFLKEKEDPRRSKIRLRNIEDIPEFLKRKDIDEEKGIQLLTKFLMQDDIRLKKLGIIYDQTGFDALDEIETVAEPGTEERLIQRAKSAANIFFKESHPSLSYEAYGAEFIQTEEIRGWRVFRVMMIGKDGENSYVKACVPLDENVCALCSDNNEKCDYRVAAVEDEKSKNKAYIDKIRGGNFFTPVKKVKKMLKLREDELNPAQKEKQETKKKEGEKQNFKFKQKEDKFAALQKQIEMLKKELVKKDSLLKEKDSKKTETKPEKKVEIQKEEDNPFLGLKSEGDNPFA